jgi:integrase
VEDAVEHRETQGEVKGWLEHLCPPILLCGEMFNRPKPFGKTRAGADMKARRRYWRAREVPRIPNCYLRLPVSFKLLLVSSARLAQKVRLRRNNLLIAECGMWIADLMKVTLPFIALAPALKLLDESRAAFNPHSAIT